MPYTNFPTVQDILNEVSQDVRQQLAATVGTPGQPILIDYTNRVHKEMLRFSRWDFLRSVPQYFITEKGQSKYWIGPTGSAPAGTVDTLLNLPDVDKIKKDSVVDISNMRELQWQPAQVWGPTLNDRTGQGISQEPKIFLSNINAPNLIQLTPPPDNANPKQPVPANPICTYVPGGALPARAYFVKCTYVDTVGGESTGQTQGSIVYIPANNLLVVKTPQIVFNYAVSGIKYGQWNVYADTAPAPQNGFYTDQVNETLQNVSPITIGTDFQEPTTGLTTTGAAVPTTNTIQQIGGYVIKFEYYKSRQTMTHVDQYLQIPEDYKDVVAHGVSAYAWKLIGQPANAQASYSLFKAGLGQMIWDKNQGNEGVQFMRPDPNTYINQQTLGYLPPFF